MTTLLHKATTDQIIGGFYAVYNEFGFGFLESVYRNSMIVELRARGLDVQPEVPIEVFYRDVSVGAFRCDLIIAGKVLVEIKATEQQSSIRDERRHRRHPR